MCEESVARFEERKTILGDLAAHLDILDLDRIGFFPEKGRWYQINATAKEIHVEEVPENRAVITGIGAGLQEEPICILLTGKAPELRLL